MRKFVGHQGQVASFGRNADATKLVSGMDFLLSYFNNPQYESIPVSQYVQNEMRYPFSCQYCGIPSVLKNARQHLPFLLPASMQEFIVWDMETGESLKTIPTENPIAIPGMSNIEFCSEDKCAAMISNAKLIILDLEAGEVVHEIEVPRVNPVSMAGNPCQP